MNGQHFLFDALEAEVPPSGMAWVSSDKYPGWKGNMMVGSLRFEYLNRCVIENDKVVKEEILLKNIGRLRTVVMGPDGYICLRGKARIRFQINAR